MLPLAKSFAFRSLFAKLPTQKVKVFENSVLGLDRHIATFGQVMHNMGQEFQEKTKQREAQRKRRLQAEVDRDAEALAFE